MFKEFAVTLFAAMLGVLFALVSAWFDVDAFETFVEFVHELEYYEIDEIFLTLFLVLFGLSIDLYRKRKRIEAQRLQLDALRGAMTNVDHVLRNLLNNLHYFGDEMRASKDISDSTVALLDQVVCEAVTELEKLESVDSIPVDAATNGIIKNKVSSR